MWFSRRASKLAPLLLISISVVAQETIAWANELAQDELQAWMEFKRQYNKTYASPEEELRRRQIFLDNKRYVDSFNTKDNNADFVQGVNSLFDLTTEEINQTRNGFRLPENMSEGFSAERLLEQLLQALNESSTLPDDHRAWYDNLLTGPNIDYRDRGLVSRVKDQGACGSCWAFATTGALESALAIRGRKILLSEQNLVDCSRRYGNKGCSGGLMDAAFRYVRDHGIMSSADYPYEARDSTCRASPERVITRVRGSMTLPRGNENLLRLVLALRGPLPVAIDASARSFHSYKSGIYNDRECKSSLRSLNHAVLLVGYGRESGRDYWLLKNSWGRSWGDLGYIKISRNTRNTCGVASYAVLPSL